MNVRIIQTCFALLLLSLAASSQAQVGASFDGELAFVSTETAPSNRTSSPSSKPTASATRFHKRFPQLFSGMAIEIATSTYPMDKSAPIFRQFGNVLYEKLPEGGYSYLIMAKFSSQDAALEFLKKVVKPKVEDAKLIQYTEGTRKVVRG